jgi:hypothetical protein
MKFLLAEQQKMYERQRQQDDAPEEQRLRREEARERERDLKEAQRRSEDRAREEQRDQQLTALGQVLSNLTTLILHNHQQAPQLHSPIAPNHGQPSNSQDQMECDQIANLRENPPRENDQTT